MEPIVLIALQNLYGMPFAVSPTPPASGDAMVRAVKYSNQYLLFDWTPSLVLPKISEKAVAAEVAQLNREAAGVVLVESRRADLDARIGAIATALEEAFPGYAALAYAEIVVGRPLLLFRSEEEIAPWLERIASV
jgi:hypothetical protein